LVRSVVDDPSGTGRCRLGLPCSVSSAPPRRRSVTLGELCSLLRISRSVLRRLGVASENSRLWCSHSRCTWLLLEGRAESAFLLICSTRTSRSWSFARRCSTTLASSLFWLRALSPWMYVMIDKNAVRIESVGKVARARSRRVVWFMTVWCVQ
jgi:hypothetical protein